MAPSAPTLLQFPSAAGSSNTVSSYCEMSPLMSSENKQNVDTCQPSSLVPSQWEDDDLIVDENHQDEEKLNTGNNYSSKLKYSMMVKYPAKPSSSIIKSYNCNNINRYNSNNSSIV